MTRPTAGSVRAALREATRDAHGRLDAHPLMADLLDGGAGIARYGRLLQSYAALYAALESAIDGAAVHVPPGFDWPKRRKLPWLEADLRALGVAPGGTQPDAAATAPVVASRAALIGMLYPLEGATLGGQAISVRLRRAMGIDASNGGRFFAGYGDETRARWQATCLALEEILGDDEAVGVAVAQAVGVFERFAVALDEAARD
ncbi:MAG: biliverdin-producing heme oxygenase [Alphaproteobacteria bacterium]|nr:biliverdin-producing heme oxygenase [Alphaproteobacteria bacterium]